VSGEARGDGEGDAEGRHRFEEPLAGLDAAEQAELGRSLAELAGGEALSGFWPGPRVSRRRARREDEVTLRVRVDLRGMRPPVWRRLELGSTMFLDEVHEVVQAAFGWTDSHLHRFAVGGASVWDREAELFLCPFDVAEGEPEEGTPEGEVRLDEVLVEPGDRLAYLYDYGDNWEHLIRLEAVLERGEGVARAVCTGGRRVGPVEDSGGVPGHEEALADGEVDEERFDVGELNDALAFAETTRAAPGWTGRCSSTPSRRRAW